MNRELESAWHKVTLFISPTGAFKGQMRTKKVHGCPLHCLHSQLAKRMKRHNLWLVDYTCIHTRTGCPFSRSESPVLFFCWPVCGGVWQRWAHNLPVPKHGELDHPWADPLWESASSICTPRCRGDRPGQTVTSVWSLVTWCLCIDWQHDSLYKALSGEWLTGSRPSRLAFTHTQSN